MKPEEVILVNEADEEIGTMEKMEVHRKALLHRAFSVFLFNSHGEMLLQQRAMCKYHSGGLWTNACCSHPALGESTPDAVHRRLVEEMGFDTPVKKLFDFVYKAGFDNGLTEYEFDHVYSGEYESEIRCNPDEVMDYCFKPMRAIAESLETRPGLYTAWFQLAFPKIESWWQQQYGTPLLTD